jgi:anti-anti-sigma factor
MEVEVSVILSEGTERPPRPEVRVELGPTGHGPYVALIDLCGEHDLATAEAVKVSLAPLRGDVLVNMSDCDFVDSVIIGILIRKARELAGEGHRLELVVPAEAVNVRRVFDTMRMGDLVTIHERMPIAS